MKLSHYVLSGVLPASLSITSSAQVAPATPATNDKSLTEDVVIMTPFQVSSAGDVGYVAANAISATRINTPLNDLPFSITAFAAVHCRHRGRKPAGCRFAICGREERDKQ